MWAVREVKAERGARSVDVGKKETGLMASLFKQHVGQGGCKEGSSTRGRVARKDVSSPGGLKKRQVTDRIEGPTEESNNREAFKAGFPAKR